MMEKSKNRPSRGPWGKRLLIIFGSLVVLLAAAYFILTSSAFFKGVILPKVGSAMNAKIEVGSASISPFSQVILRDLRLRTTGEEPLLTAELVRVRYSLMAIVRGNMDVRELTLETPVIHIVQELDGSSNLDPLLEGGEDEQDDDGKDDDAPRLNLRNVALKNGTIRRLEKQSGANTNLIELSGLNITLDQLGNNQSGKLEIASGLRMFQTQPGTNDLLRGAISGAYTIALTQDLMPQTLQGSASLSVTDAQGSYADLQQVNATLAADMTPTEIRQIALQFARGGQPLGTARISGPVNLETMDARLKIELVSIDRNMLSLAAAGTPWDFRESTINSTNEIQVSRNGTFIAAAGNLAGRQISIQQQDLVTPPVSLDADYQLTVNLENSSAVLQKLDVRGAREGEEFLRTALDQQMNISWGESVQGFREASLRMILTNFNLADWRAVIGTNIDSGLVNMQMSVVAQQDGKLLRTTLDAQVRNLSARFDTNQIQQADATFGARGTIENLNVVNFPEYSFALMLQGDRAAAGNGALRLNLESEETSAQLTAEASLPALLRVMAAPGVAASAGVAKISANYSDAGGAQKAAGTFALEKFTGTYEEYQFQDFRAAFEYNVEIAGQKLEIRRAAGSFSQGFDSGGTLDLTGNYHLETSAGRFAFKTVDLNQHTFRPFLQPYLGENQLVSISVNSSGNATLDPEGDTRIEAAVNVEKWVVRDPAGTLPSEPLSAGLKLDGSMAGEKLTLREFLVKLSPTDRAGNELRLTAELDLAPTNAGPSTLSLASSAFDVTPYYNMFAAQPATNAPAQPAPAEPAPQAPAPEPAQEPEAMDLPFQQLTADLKIDRFYLRELAISNWVGKLAIQSNVVRIEPFQMNVNGGDVKLTGNFNVGVPGYRYQLGFGAEAVPVEPLANTLGDTNAQGQLQGTLFTQGEIRGQGITGPSLRQHLAGDFNLNLTNLNYQIVGPKLKRILVPIAAVLRVPELADTPINWVSARSTIGEGQVKLDSLGVESEAFFAKGTGAIVLNDVLTNSTLNLPLDLALRRSLAIKSRVVAQGSVPEDARYVDLPRFVTIRGTLGAPEPDISKTAIAGILARAAANAGLGSDKTEGILGGLGDILSRQGGGTNATGTNAPASGNLLKDLRGLLGGQAAEGGTNATTTNAPGTNASPAASILRGLGGLLGSGDQQAGTNAAPSGTNAPATNAQPRSPLDLLRGVQREQ